MSIIALGILAAFDVLHRHEGMGEQMSNRNSGTVAERVKVERDRQGGKGQDG